MRFSKEYDNEIEDNLRMKIYLANKDAIQQHNKLYEQGLVSYEMEMNQFGDMVSTSSDILCRKIEEMDGY